MSKLLFFSGTDFAHYLSGIEIAETPSSSHARATLRSSEVSVTDTNLFGKDFSFSPSAQEEKLHPGIATLHLHYITTFQTDVGNREHIMFF